MSVTHEIGLVFVSGAGLGSWIWEPMESRLEFPHLFVDFPGRDGGESDTQGLTLDDYVVHVRGQVDELSASRVVIVAHSLGGVIALKLAENLPDRLAGFAGVGATIPRDGGSFISSLPLAKRVLTTALLRVAGTRPPESAIRKGLCSGLSPAQTEQVVRRFAPESRAVYIERAEAAAPEVPRMYVRLTEDIELDVALQDQMARNLGAVDVRDIASGHMPMLSAPDQLAATINGFAASLESSSPR